jgi:glyoxylase-like metal-dependent hydrolase (beta-lactamase superfamily II)
MFELIETGRFYADGGAMFGAVPKVTWSRLYPVNERNLCELSMHVGVVRTVDGRVVVIDPGVGCDCLNDTPAIGYGFHGMTDLVEALRARTGVSPEDVTDVIFTHLHFDHCGGAVSGGKPVFPNAAHHVSRKQLEYYLNPHPLEKYSFLASAVEALATSGVLHVVESEEYVSESIRLRLYDGHTPGQTGAFLRASEGNICFPGDVVPLSSHIVAERISAYDLNPSLSWYAKIDILEQAVNDEALVVFYHDVATPCGKIKKVGASFKLLSK